jgi:hypothetical protein
VKHYWDFLKNVLEHKRLVFLECLRLGLPLWLAIIHDWSKFRPSEFVAYADFFHGMAKFPEQASVKEAFLHACELHYIRNKHHWNHWVKNGLAEPMPEMYRLEMLADWWAVARGLGNDDPLVWYLENYYKIKLHRDTRLWMDRYLMGMPNMIGTLEEVAQLHNGDVLLMKQSFLDDAKNFKTKAKTT